MACARPEKNLPACVIRPMTLEEIPAPRWDGPAVGRKAIAIPAKREIWIDRMFWNSLRGIDARAAILFHEVGHLEGAKCEPCADRQAGRWLKELGFPTARDARRAMLAELENRDAQRAQRELAEGFGLDDAMPRQTVTGYREGVGYQLTLVLVSPGAWVEDGECAEAWEAAFKEAKAAGISWTVNSAFRTWAQQDTFWKAYQAGTGAKAARPGYGTHQQGLSLDLSFASDTARERFAAIASKHGIERDVSGERWHFTYGGKRRFPLALGAGVALAIVAIGALASLKG